MKIKRFNSLLLVAFAIVLLAGLVQTVPAQFPIKIPKLPKPTPTPAVTVPTDNGGGIPNNGKVPTAAGQTDVARLPGYPDASLAAPVVDATSIRFLPRTIPNSYPTPNGEKNYDVWSWTPRLQFIVRGPLEAGSVVSFEFTNPNGSPWLAEDCPNGEAEKYGGTEFYCGNDIDEHKGLLQTGVFGFKIKLVNELQGKNTVLYAGRVKIDKWVYNPANNPKAAKNFEYYAVSDWKLPTAYLYVPKTPSYDDHGPLVVQFWFRGASQTVANLTGYLFYQGKQVASTLTDGGANRVTEPYSEQASRDSENEYYARDFWFDALVFDNNRSANTQNLGFPIYKNPGEYEVKVLQNGKLARVAKFTVEGGRIVDSRFAADNRLGTTRYLIPAQIVGTQDGPWNRTGWASEVFYGNALNGFPAP
ncbi:MAG: hypothetical protein JSS81_23040 [Acidobacteria bacterium]|nr:hypothetical protein [Acidobacteriota bacterium]